MAINPQKVLIICNTNTAAQQGTTLAALSSSVADWYATARGLRNGSNQYFRLDFDFGSNLNAIPNQYAVNYSGVTDATYNPTGAVIKGTYSKIMENITCAAKSVNISSNVVGLGIFAAIATVIAANGIEALLVTPGVPGASQGYWTANVGYFTFQPIECSLRFAPYQLTLAVNNRREQVAALNNGPASISGSSPTLPKNYASVYPITGWNNPTRCIPCGRIGTLDFPIGTTFSTLTQVQTMVNAAIAAELENNLTKTHFIGGTSYAFGGDLTHTQQANKAAYDAGVTDLRYSDCISGTWNGTSIHCNGDRPLSPLPAFAFCQAGQTLYSPLYPDVTNPGGAYYTNSLSYLPGAWCFEWASIMAYYGSGALWNGASLGFADWDEPFAAALPPIDYTTELLFRGYSGAEAIYRADQQSSVSAWGDPLYAPYKKTALQYSQIG